METVYFPPETTRYGKVTVNRRMHFFHDDRGERAVAEARFESAKDFNAVIFDCCDDVRSYYDGIFTIGFLKKEYGRGKVELHCPAEGVALIVCSGSLNEDLRADLRTPTDEMFCLCNLSGSLELTCPGVRQMLLKEKEVVFSPPDRTEPVHCTLRVPGGEAFQYAAVCIERGAWKRVFNETLPFLNAGASREHGAVPLWTGAVPQIHSVFFELCNARMNNAASERLLLCSCAMRIAAYIFDLRADAEKYPVKPEDAESLLIANIPNRMLRDTVNPPTVAELAQELGISATKLKNGFKAIYGVPIYTMFKKMKLESAYNMLRTTSCTIGEVAFQCGYQSQSQFCDAFKRQYGVTPSRLRAQYRQTEKK